MSLSFQVFKELSVVSFGDRGLGLTWVWVRPAVRAG